MVTRRTDARRRRVLNEEFVPTDDTVVAGNDKPMQAYSFAANRRNQPKTTDLIPKRATALSLFFLFIVSCVAGFNVLAYNATALVDVIGESGARSVALFGTGTFANWFCSISLFLCAGICVQLYMLRQHKRDDYGGMYRVWILMAIMFVIASVDCAIDLRSIGAKLFEHLTHRSLLQTPWLMLTIEMIVLAIIVLRMLFEVRASRVSLTAVLLVWLGFVGCIVLRNVQLPESLASVDHSLAYGNCILLGCVGSLVALTMYARFVFLHAHGLIELRVKAAKPVEDTEPEIENTTNSTIKIAATESETSSTRQSTASPARTSAAAPVAASAPAPLAAKQAKTTSTTKKASKLAKARKSQPATSTQKTVVQQKLVTPQSKPAATKKAAAPASNASAAEEPPETLKMSKADRRRQRKLEKRAARAEKAA